MLKTFNKYHSINNYFKNQEITKVSLSFKEKHISPENLNNRKTIPIRVFPTFPKKYSPITVKIPNGFLFAQPIFLVIFCKLVIHKESHRFTD